MSEKIDARGLSCPQPVVLVKKAIDRLGKGEIEVWVDTVTSKENVSRLARNAGFQVTEQEEEGEFMLKLAKD
ncbi:MAG: sulfurtransferase TusA family protein [Deltaproteobacteria bacterium]|jgi:tRNA 2-thiouridine synthesizing protein A|nr:sulfurtransferase TusA family protein [Deltaproteobacteria bacterium]